MYTAAVAVTPIDVHVRVHGAAGAPTGRGDMKRRTWGAAGPWAPSGGCGPATAAASALTSGARSDRPDAAGGAQTQLILGSKLHAAHACAIGFDAKRRHQGAITRGVHPHEYAQLMWVGARIEKSDERGGGVVLSTTLRPSAVGSKPQIFF